MQISKVLKSGSVTRYHQTCIDVKQTVDQHSWETAIILQYIYPECSKELLVYALTHDCGELLTGDIPSPVKHDNPELKAMLDKLEADFVRTELKLKHPEFDSMDLLAIKCADILSGIYFTNKRACHGDPHAREICNKYLQYLEELPEFSDTVDEVLWTIMRGDEYDVQS